MTFRRPFLLIVAALALSLTAAGTALADRAGRQLLRDAFAQAGIETEAAEAKVALLDEIVEKLAERHVDRIDSLLLGQRAAAAIGAAPGDAEQDFDAAVAALTAALDPYTTYLDPGEWDDLRVSISGRFSGIGVELALKDQMVTVIAPIDGSPAAEAGVQPDDRILAVDDEPTAKMSLSQVVGRLRGPEGQPVRVRVRGGDGSERSLTLVRNLIRMQPVKARLEGDVAYVRISQFSGGAAALLRAHLLDLDRQAAFGVKGIVLDLRRNPGGLLDEAVKMADLFLENVAIVSVRGREPAEDDHHRGRAGEILAGIPMAVLIDGASASAAEILAAALHDNGRARLIGQNSYGKGSVQALEKLSRGGVRVTVARDFRPNDQPIDGVGIAPDETVSPAEGGDAPLRRALAVVRAEQ